MVKLDDESKERFRKFIRDQLIARGIDPDSINIEPIVEDPALPLDLPDGERIQFVQVAHPNYWGSYARAANFLGTGMDQIADALSEAFNKAQTILEDGPREDACHDACHDAIARASILLSMMKLLMPCQNPDDMKGNAPACDTVQ